MKKLNTRFFLLIAFLLVNFHPYQSLAKDNKWQKIDEGLFVGRFSISKKNDSKIVVIKIDPHLYDLKLYCAGEQKHDNLTAEEWAKKYDLIGVVNAGMFSSDYLSNVGYMKNFKYLNNKRINKKYHSVAAFHPHTKDLPPFRIYDIDVTPMSQVVKNYNTVIQNLRLIKRPAKNRWSQQPRKWSEVALGEDKDGNALFIFSRAPLTVHDFNKTLIALPISIVCAQHLEGGPEASLYFSCKNTQIKLMGSFETSFNENDNNIDYWPLPNVIGFKKK